MRTFTVIVASAVAGVVVGAAMAYIEVRPSAVVSLPSTAAADRQSSDTAAPRVEVEGGNTYHFGQMQRGTSKSHEFTLKNVGGAPLSVRVVSTTCKCTVGNVSSAPVPPGGSVPVKLEWTALTNPGQFRQTASLETNDPQKSRLELLVEGDVTDASGVYPRDFVFDQVTAGESRSAHVYVMALLQDTLEVGKPTLSNPELEKFFDVKAEKVDRADLPVPQARDGVRITLTAKPGLPLGRFDQVLELPTNLPDAEKLKIPVIGRVVGNISVHGRHWVEDQGVLRIGHVKSSVGAQEDLNLVVRGDSASTAKLAITSIDPPELKAALGEPKLLKDTLLHVPLTIEVPKGTPPMARLDTQQSDEARVVLSTGLTDVPEMAISVRFAVER